MSLNTTPRTWVSGEVVTAAEMNTEVRDAITGIQAVANGFTPAWTGSVTNPAIGNGFLTGRFMRVGHFCDFVIIITMGSTTTFGSGTWSTGLPVTPQGASMTFYGQAFDSSVLSVYPLGGTTGGGASIVLRVLPAAAGSFFGNTTPTTPMTWAIGDVLTLPGRFETA